ncbi:MAG: septum formation inhibitor Maf [Xanthomonadales bacterium]|nr:septum formation inhibitor Maf [Xanthomonadales bacterium]NIN59398.1 septum formation inhibitor Maf [Xanthomonadales bacterium]NIN74749.1 septum formation inhibitor Maf [Xanthomonadales bacterium]NIO14885.1 septum formation inhibitor Maf [Xanthomonadales bacterium]NIP11791.1 septum formation inhibitor Maf [Xanthomonadales bacterium]
MSVPAQLVLASGSPRRKSLLRQLDVRFRVLPLDIDESRQAGESPATYVVRLARAKAAAGWDLAGDRLPVLGADTAVVIGQRILGKPADPAEARAMLSTLSGRAHQVYSAIALATGADTISDRLNVTRVEFSILPEVWIDAYCATDEPMDKAGAYAIQGGAAAHIRRIEGSFSGVMGLPLFETAELLRTAGLLA